MQRNEVKAYRQRLLRAGFTDIFIMDNGNGTYFVSCTAPDGTRIREHRVTIETMCATPKVIYFSEYGI